MTKNCTTGIVCAAGLMLLAGSAQAETTTTFTADNHYAIYAEYGGILELIGANESGPSGAPGAYNWSLAETFTFDTPDAIYIAAWSDDRVAQGLLGQLNVDGVESVTGDGGWQVFATGIDLDNDAMAPHFTTVAAQIAYADQIDAWEQPYFGFSNVESTEPWGKIAGVSEDANWIWRNSGRGGVNPLIGNVNHDEFLIFRQEVPTPGALTLFALGGVASIRRRRTA